VTTTSLTTDELRALGRSGVTTVEMAGRALGLSRGMAYALARRNEFPVPVIKATQRRWVVPTAPLLRLLGLDGEASA
jgi:hypothetical protein